MGQSACELVRKGKVKIKGNAVESIKTTSGRKVYLCGWIYDAVTEFHLDACHRCPLSVSRYIFVDEMELAENGISQQGEHLI